jgi:hypothetical protein
LQAAYIVVASEQALARGGVAQHPKQSGDEESGTDGSGDTYSRASSVMLAAFANATLRGTSRLAYTALALALTMILKRCRLVEVEEPERNSAMQGATVLAPEGENSFGEGSGPGKSRIHSEVGRQFLSWHFQPSIVT